MNTTHYDIAVIGGGLAGLSSSILAADAGYRVVLFEKEEYPLHRVCGEYISMESHDFLQRLGIPFNAWQLPVINELELTDTKGNAYHFKLPLGGFGISRYKLDEALYQIALAKGVDAFTGTRVTDIRFTGHGHLVQTAAQSFTSTAAVGSYGKRSNLDISWRRKFILQKPDKLNNYIGVKYHVQYPQKPGNIALHNFTNGYCGISAIEDNKCCLCYLTTAENLKRNNNSIPQMEEAVLFKNPFLKDIFAKAEFLYDKPLVISQVSFSPKTHTEDHVVMAGDAAGMITPLCGNGMSMAMHGAKIAFENIQAFLNHSISREKMEAQYAQQWDTLFKRRLFTGRIVQRLFGNDRSTTLFLKTMHALPGLSEKIISMTHGERF